MLSILISALVTAVIAGALIATNSSIGAIVTLGFFGFLATFLLIGFFVRKKSSKVQDELQNRMQAAQRRMQRKVQQFQNKPGGNVKQIQRQLEMDQRAMFKEGLEITKGLEPFRKWSPMMGRQIATMRLQFNYQLKEFETVDEILAGCGFLRGPMMMDPLAVGMRMARSYANGDIEGAKKVYKRQLKWLRGERGTLLYAVMSWIYVKTGEPDEARRVLAKAKDATGSEVFVRNWEHLSNNRVKSFSNAGFGDQWYSLQLETPPQPKQQRMRGAHGRNPRGF
ncbi:hypothetical protein [Pelagicoccus albus]|uniref:Tetratricopeptide repeat-containing protein n=1 Tax=Pelagicoccus albus TaxID=415222 RepID=A0A7X1B872_9BACT|nr:hypothetical protein [Pelagicoccus albus]MBC2607478.1 hypothetical protein [Pelagicoccus albus]